MIYYFTSKQTSEIRDEWLTVSNNDGVLPSNCLVCNGLREVNRQEDRVLEVARSVRSFEEDFDKFNGSSAQ